MMSEAVQETSGLYDKWHFILVGASHVSCLHDVMVGLNMQSATLGTTYWYPTKKNCAKMVEDLREVLDGLEDDPARKTAIIFNTLDKAYFQASGKDGNCILHRSLNGVNHIDGDLVACPNENIKFMFELMLPVFETAKDLTSIFLMPIPRYIWKGWCADIEHAPNRHMRDL
jgi:hypothetical protein